MSDHRCGDDATRRAFAHVPSRRSAGRLTLAAALMAGAAGCSSSPAYPIRAGEAAGDSSVMAVQPRYPISSRDAAENAADRAAQANGARPGYPAYGSAPAPPPQASVYGARPAAAPAPSADDAADEAPRPMPHSSVDSADLPPPAPAPPADAYPPPPPPPGADPPHAISFGGGQIVFGTDSVGAAPLEFAAYRHHRHAATDAAAAPTALAASDADTPYQTVVRPGEKLADVAARVHSSREALSALNDVKHPRHMKAGTVLKIPYRYSYDVQKGDTLYTIAHRFAQDPQAIAKLNGLKAVPTLQPGQSIDLPPSAQDTGKRDHATAAGPSPVAAPAKLADAALRKVERHGRHRHGEAPVETAAADAAPAPTETASQAPTHGRRGRRGHVEAPVVVATAPPAYTPPAVTPPPATPLGGETPAAAATEAAQAPARPYTPPATGLSASSVAAAGPSDAAPSTYAGVRPPPAPAASGVVAGYGYRPAAPVPPSAATPAPSYRAAATPPSLAYRTPSIAPSTSVATGYAARGTVAAAGSDSTRMASLTPPRYAPTYAAGGYAPSLGRERASTPALSAGALTPTEITAAGRGRFVWPLRGQLISGFGDKGTGQHNDGVDIAAIPGAGVHAAAAGEVVYAGSSIPGFGNLVLVKHPGGWVTAYAHLDRIEVRMRDSVAQGEELGQAGQTGAVDRPQLHFEVRYAPDPAAKARPVDPTLVLPTG